MACYWQNVWSVTSLQTSNFLSVARHADICIMREDAWWPDKSSDFKRSVTSMPCRHWHNVWRCMMTWQVLTGDDYGSGDWMVSVLLFQVDSMPTTWSELACMHCTVCLASVRTNLGVKLIQINACQTLCTICLTSNGTSSLTTILVIWVASTWKHCMIHAGNHPSFKLQFPLRYCPICVRYPMHCSPAKSVARLRGCK